MEDAEAGLTAIGPAEHCERSTRKIIKQGRGLKRTDGGRRHS